MGISSSDERIPAISRCRAYSSPPFSSMSTTQPTSGPRYFVSHFEPALRPSIPLPWSLDYLNSWVDEALTPPSLTVGGGGLGGGTGYERSTESSRGLRRLAPAVPTSCTRQRKYDTSRFLPSRLLNNLPSFMGGSFARGSMKQQPLPAWVDS